MKNENNINPVNSSKSFKVQEVIILVIITCVASFFAGTSVVKVNNSSGALDNDSKTVKMSDALQSFVENYNYIIDNYYEELDEEELVKAAMEGMMTLLDDPYSIYMEEESYNNLNFSLMGSYKGLGVEITKETTNGYIYVLGVFDDSPAAKAGIVAGDYITSLNGVSAAEFELSEFTSKIINGTATEFIIGVQHDGEEKDVTISKENVVITSVDSNIYEVNNKKIGYIYISIFAANTYNQFKQELNKLEKEGIDSLILDVRGNTGGHLTTVEKMISLFVDSDHIIYQLQVGDKISKVYSEGNKDKKYPIVFLANQYSASASEVFISSLKDNLDAILVGSKTYGKGTVQELKTLTTGDQYKITTKKWLTPSGTWINDTNGIVPDIEVELTEDYLNNPSDDTDSQLQAALNYLSK